MQEVMAGPDGAAMTEVRCGFRESLEAAPCGCAIPVAHASNVHWRLLNIQKPVRKISLLDIQEAGGFQCDEHRKLLKEAGVEPELVLTTKQINDLGSRRRNEALRDDDHAAIDEAKRQAAAEHERKLAAAKAFAAATFVPKKTFKVESRGKTVRFQVHSAA
ncbi:MAG: hypothetical protein Q8P78_01040 [bacterium]|nr:hypothetical protein [bacterium]